MKDKKLTAYLAELGKVGFSDKELDDMSADLDNIIELMDNVREFDCSDRPYTQDAVKYNNLRADDERGHELIKLETDSFKVPKVV